MNSWEFEQKQVQQYGSVNIITKHEEGFHVMFRKERSYCSDLKSKGRLKFYTSISMLKKYSKVFNPTAKTILVEKKGTDLKNAIVKEI